MPKVNHKQDRAHVIMSFDLNQGDFEDFISEIKKSKFFPNLIGLEVKRPNFGNPVLGLGALLLRADGVSIEADCSSDNEEDSTSESIDDLTDVDEGGSEDDK